MSFPPFPALIKPHGTPPLRTISGGLQMTKGTGGKRAAMCALIRGAVPWLVLLLVGRGVQRFESGSGCINLS